MRNALLWFGESYTTFLLHFSESFKYESTGPCVDVSWNFVWGSFYHKSFTSYEKCFLKAWKEVIFIREVFGKDNTVSKSKSLPSPVFYILVKCAACQIGILVLLTLHLLWWLPPGYRNTAKDKIWSQRMYSPSIGGYSCLQNLGSCVQRPFIFFWDMLLGMLPEYFSLMKFCQVYQNQITSYYQCLSPEIVPLSSKCIIRVSFTISLYDEIYCHLYTTQSG
jgi:hypothetical protein